MATAAQIEANRLNLQKSTGPRTLEGKARARRRLGIPGSQAETGDEIHRLRARVMRTQLGDWEIDRVVRHIAGKLMPGLQS